MLAIMTELSAITAANKSEYGRLAQLVEHLLDVQGVRDSSSLPSTTQKTTMKRTKARNIVVFIFAICEYLIKFDNKNCHRNGTVDT